MTETKKEETTKPDDGATKTVEQLTEELKTSEANLATANQGVADGKAALKVSEDKLQTEIYSPKYLKFLQEEEDNGKAKPLPEEKKDFDKMSMGEIVGHIKGEVGKAISASQETTQKEIKKLGRLVEAIIVSGDVDKAAAKYDDFYDFKDSMAELSKKNPQLGAVQLYRLAKFGKIEDDISKKNTVAAEDKHVKPGDTTKKVYKTTEEAATAAAEELDL